MRETDRQSFVHHNIKAKNNKLATAFCSMSSASTAAPLTFDPFDPQRKNAFLVEWRVTSAAVCKTLADAQARLAAGSQGNVAVRQSCASDNFHVTLNEWVLDSPAKLAAARQLLADFAATHLPALVAKAAAQAQATGPPLLHLDALRDFRKKEAIFFVGLKGPGVALLDAVYRALQQCMGDAGLVPAGPPKRDLVTHITIGRGQNPGPWCDQVLADPHWAASLSGADAGEIVFCSKRFGAEPTPPVIMSLYSGGAVAAAAPAAAAAAAAATHQSK